MLIAFWKLRLSDNVSIQPAKGPPPNPIKYIPRFISQKRLVLAWTLAVGRNGWWLMFFVYTPIFVTQSGYSPELGGALVSLGVVPMIFVRQWGKIGQKIGLRKLLMGAYAATGVISHRGRAQRRMGHCHHVLPCVRRLSRHHGGRCGQRAVPARRAPP